MKFKEAFVPDTQESCDYPKEIVSLWAQHASQEAIFERLRSAEEQKDEFYWHGFGSNVEQYLLSRNEPLINLGLAAFAHDSKVTKFIYQNGGSQAKALILKGRFIVYNLYAGWWTDSSVRDLVERDDLDLLCFLFRNDHLTVSLITDILKKKGIFQGLSNRSWRVFMYTLTSKKDSRISVSEHLSEESNYDEREMFEALWSLFETLPSESDTLDDLNSALDVLSYITEHLKNAILSRNFSNALIDFNKRSQILQKWEKSEQLRNPRIYEFLIWQSKIKGPFDLSAVRKAHFYEKTKPSQLQERVEELAEIHSARIEENFKRLSEQLEKVKIGYADERLLLESSIEKMKSLIILLCAAAVLFAFFRK